MYAMYVACEQHVLSQIRVEATSNRQKLRMLTGDAALCLSQQAFERLHYCALKLHAQQRCR